MGKSKFDRGWQFGEQIIGSLQSLSRRAFARTVTTKAMLAVLGAGLLGASRSRQTRASADLTSGATEDVQPAGDLSFAGRVVDVETGLPISGVEIHIDYALPATTTRGNPPLATPVAIRADAEGRFQLAFRPEQVAEPARKFTLRVRHPGFISRNSLETDLATILRHQALGDRPFFETIRLEKGVEYTARIVTPTGKPVAGVPYLFENWSGGVNDSRGFQNQYVGRTDAEGWFRLRSPQSSAVALYLLPVEPAKASFPYASYQHFWGTDRSSGRPAASVPTDLGRIVLERGVRLPGRLVDGEGRPIAGQTIMAYSVGKIEHSATTEADGSFVLGPLRYGNYQIYGADQEGFCYIHWDWVYRETRHGPNGGELSARSSPSPARAIMPVKVYLNECATPEPVLLQELSTVQVVVRFVDSRGNPAVGGPALIEGTMPSVSGARQSSLMGRPASSINDPEPEDTGQLVEWRMHGRPDAQGRVVFRAPVGLKDASIHTASIDETIAYKTRFKDDGPLHPFGDAGFGVLHADCEVTIVSYKAATVLVTVTTEDGATPPKLNVGAGFTLNQCSYGNSFKHQTDGRYRGYLMPDHEYRISASSDDYVPQMLPRLTLAEGGFTELTIALRKRPKPPEIGKPAPPFSVNTIDGRALSLDDLRGKFVLLHFWTPHPWLGLTELPHLKAVADRFGKEERFKMVSLCLDHDPEVGTRWIQESGLSLEQVLFRDYGLSTMAVDYAASPTPKSFLISPDGTLIANDLKGDQIEKTVIEALGG